MTTGDAADGRPAHEDRDPRLRIGVGGGDESVTRMQLAARWAEAFSIGTDSLGGMLKRFRVAYDYLDAVTHGIEPTDLDRELPDVQKAPQPATAPVPSAIAPSNYAPSSE
jgi:hypothetical protein